MVPETKETPLQSELTQAHSDYARGLSSYALFKIHDRESSQDLVQNTFLKTWKYLVRGGKIEMMKAFLYHVLNNLIVDEYRKLKHKNASLDELLEKGFEPSDETSEHPVTIASAKMAVQTIDRLPTKYRRVMKMRFVDMLTLSEMSIIVGQTKNTIAVQIHRGLAKLKLIYDPA